MNDKITAAIEYATRGWYVFPLIAGSKEPATKNGHHAATLSIDQIKKWWGDHPDRNIGISCDPSGLTVYDVDVGPEKNGAVSHAAIVDQLPATAQVRTRSGGIHLYYLAPAGAPLRKIGVVPNGVQVPDGQGSGLDLIASGYVVAPPSIVDGGEYIWEDQGALAPLPNLLAHAGIGRAVQSQAITTEIAAIGEGGRNNALFALACRLREAGLTVGEVQTALEKTNADRIKPPLDAVEIASIASKACLRAEFDVQRTNDLMFRVRSSDDQRNPDDDLHKLLLSEASKIPQAPFISYPTGLPELDRCLGGGVTTRQITTILGGPAAGKTALLTSLCLNLATTSTHPPILFVSCELEFYEIAARFAAEKLQTPWRDLVRISDDTQKISEATAGLSIYVVDWRWIPKDFDERLAKILTTLRKIQAIHGQAPVLAVDYLQKLAGSSDSQRGRVDDLIDALRLTAQSVPCAVVVISSTARSGYGTALTAIRESGDPKAYLGLGKESGLIEYESGAVLFADVDSIDGDRYRRGVIAVAKSRHGTTGFVGTKFDPVFGTYTPDDIRERSAPKNAAHESIKRRAREIVEKNPGAFSQAELAAKLGAGALALIAGLIADGEFYRVGKKLAVGDDGDGRLA